MPGIGPFGGLPFGSPMHRLQYQSIMANTPNDAAETPLVLREELLLSAIIIPGDRTAEGRLVQGIAIPWFRILKELERDPELLHRLTPRQLEELVAGAYSEDGKEEGWIVELTPASGDRGRDVRVTARLPGIGEIRIIDQVKKYASRHVVPADDVRAVAGVLLRDQDVSKAVITTTSTFAPGVQSEFSAFTPTRIQLKDGPELTRWLKEIALSGG